MNVFDFTPPKSGNEAAMALFSAENCRIERIVSAGAASPLGFWYDQEENEVVFVLEGWGCVAFPDGEKKTLGPGDFLFLPAGKKHRVEATSTSPSCLWLCVFFPA